MKIKLHCKKCNNKVIINSFKELKLFKYYGSLCDSCLHESFKEYYNKNI